MRRIPVALVCACLLAAPLAPHAAIAKDTPLRVELDGRRLDAQGPSALLHRGRAFINVVRITKGFDGLLTFGKGDSSVKVTVGDQTALFIVGHRAGTMNGRPARFSAAPFILNGDTYVPLDAVATLARATLAVDTRHHIARLESAPVPAAT